MHVCELCVVVKVKTLTDSKVKLDLQLRCVDAAVRLLQIAEQSNSNPALLKCAFQVLDSSIKIALWEPGLD